MFFLLLIWSYLGISLNRDKKGSLDFKFSGVLGPNSTQLDVYKHCNSVINGAVDGVNTCIMAYGQTGSGKSYSMIGYGANKGIVPISCNEIFERMSKNDNPNLTYEVQVSMLEIYNERI